MVMRGVWGGWGGNVERNVTGISVNTSSVQQLKLRNYTSSDNGCSQTGTVLYKSSGSEIRPTKIGPQEPTNLSQLSCTKWPDK